MTVAPTMDDVAARAGVSRAAVSMALRGSPKVSAARRAEIERAAAELGYRPNANASRLARSRTGAVGVVFSDLHNALYAEMLDGLAAALDPGPEQMLLASGFRDPDRERGAVEAFLALRVDGLALLGSELPDAEIQGLAREVPLVVAGRRVAGVGSVTVDDAAGAVLATEHLLDLGHRRIAHIDGGNGAGAALRRAAFLATMARHGLARQAVVVAGDYTEPTGRAAAAELLDARRPPTAVFAANDASALGVLSAVGARGTAVPEALSVIGFDNTTAAQLAFVDLSTIDYARHEMGARTATLLTADRTVGEITLTPRLVPRRTTARLSPRPRPPGRRP